MESDGPDAATDRKRLLAGRLLQWRTPVRWRRIVLVAGVVVFLIQGIRVATHPGMGDFDLHWTFGNRLVSGIYLYDPNGGIDQPYPPFWALAHAPLSMFPSHVAQLLLYPLFLGALALLLRVLNRLSEKHLPLTRDRVFWTAALAVFLTSRYLVRDMPECGVNLALVALSWLGVSLWAAKREWLGGLSLGLATSLKCTPALFLAYFLWKRQWKMSIATSVAAVAFSVSPALFMAPADSLRAARFWVGNVWQGVAAADPTVGVLGEEPVQNMSLKTTLARYLMRVPEGHAARIDHPLYADFLDLPPAAAGAVARSLVLALLVGVFWTLRRPIKDRTDEAVLWECAIVSLLILLLSPITWGQHCVGALPALYLLIRRFFARGRLPAWTIAVLAVYAVVVLGLNREFVGQRLAWLLESYHLETWCLVALVGTLLFRSDMAGLSATAKTFSRTERRIRQGESGGADS